MKIVGIIWLQKIIGKLINIHHISQDEVARFFMSKPQYRILENCEIEDERVFSAYGQTAAGRYLTVIFIRKFGNRALVISARNMNKEERKQYGQ